MDVMFAGTLLMLIYPIIIVAICAYVLTLLSRFVKAHQRGAEALETIARKLSGNNGNH